jgi:hypothetical protein
MQGARGGLRVCDTTVSRRRRVARRGARCSARPAVSSINFTVFCARPAREAPRRCEDAEDVDRSLADHSAAPPTSLPSTSLRFLMGLHLLAICSAAALAPTPLLRHSPVHMKRRDDAYYKHLVGEGRDWARPRRQKRRADEPRGARSKPASTGSFTSSDELALDIRQLLPYLGQEMGSSGELVRICAKASGHDHDTCAALQAAGGHRTRATGVITWANASVLLINAAADVHRRRNVFWQEEDALLFSWFPDRGQALDDPAVACLLDPEWPVLLFCRLDREWPFVFAGRLEPVALSLAEGDGEEERPRGPLEGYGLPVWSTPRSGISAAADHVVWRLVDAEYRAVRAALFEGTGSLVETARPVQYIN